MSRYNKALEEKALNAKILSKEKYLPKYELFQKYFCEARQHLAALELENSFLRVAVEYKDLDEILSEEENSKEYAPKHQVYEMALSTLDDTASYVQDINAVNFVEHMAIYLKNDKNIKKALKTMSAISLLAKGNNFEYESDASKKSTDVLEKMNKLMHIYKTSKDYDEKKLEKVIDTLYAVALFADESSVLKESRLKALDAVESVCEMIIGYGHDMSSIQNALDDIRSKAFKTKSAGQVINIAKKYSKQLKKNEKTN